MARYIELDALVAEIEKTRKALNLNLRHDQGVCDGLYAIQKYINTLEVKEVDLEKILIGFQNRYAYENSGEFPSAIEIAKHFYELGMAVNNKAQKGE